MDEIRDSKKNATAPDLPVLDEDTGKYATIDDLEVDTFYGSSTTRAYRMKSELVGKCMEEIGMGWYLFPHLHCLEMALTSSGSNGSFLW